MKKLIIIFSLIMLTACISKNTENMEQEYGVLNQTFSQLEPTEPLYRDEFFYADNLVFNKNQKEFIKNYLYSRNIDTNKLDFSRLKLLIVKDSLKDINNPEYGRKEKKKLDLDRINRNTDVIIILSTDTVFKDIGTPIRIVTFLDSISTDTALLSRREVYEADIEFSRVLFNKQHTKSIYEILALENESKMRHICRVYSNYKNGAWYIYKTERISANQFYTNLSANNQR